ncbi:MAG: prepilin peptidase [Candidatus Gracilibacteria bacterium]|jgi:prepilin signal peptidase PulO-like enzyme (type II secretory pathway)
MTLLVAALIFIFGTIIGSFLSVVIHRLRTDKKGILFSRSICPACKKQLKWRHLVPVFSWLFLRGKCGYCGSKISSHYLTLELATGLTFLATFLAFNFLNAIPLASDPTLFDYSMNWQTFELFIFYIIEFSFLIGIFFYDYLHQEIPDSLSIPAIVIAIAGGIIFHNPSMLGMLIGGAGIFTFFLLQLLISKGKWIGGGDLRMGLLIGVLFGWEKALIALVISYVLGSIVGLYLIARGKATRKSAIAFGPFLVIGTMITVFFGDLLLISYLSMLAI